MSLPLSGDGLFEIAKKFHDSSLWKVATQLTSNTQLSEDATVREYLWFRIIFSKITVKMWL